jgi:hypothetical protein
MSGTAALCDTIRHTRQWRSPNPVKSANQRLMPKPNPLPWRCTTPPQQVPTPYAQTPAAVGRSRNLPVQTGAAQSPACEIRCDTNYRHKFLTLTLLNEQIRKSLCSKELRICNKVFGCRKQENAILALCMYAKSQTDQVV